ncbi:MAG: secondary thiamine-phosphate synthase enzyme [Candidatus Krumholzibacteriia bacterium]|jgi:secondary thiamine-phosphate synthase enzyme
MIKLEVQTHQRTDFIDVTSLIAGAVKKLNVVDGVVTVFVPHTTAAITINEGSDPDVVTDMSKSLNRIVPWEDGYLHAEGNAAAHIKASFFGSSVSVIVAGGRLQLGTWQVIWFCDFDGPRHRHLWVQAITGAAAHS